MLRRESPIAKLSAGAIVLGYVISAILWITLSDRVLGVLVGDPATLVTLSILKGWGFVALTGAVLAFLLRRLEVGRARQTSELEARENRFRLLAEHAQDVIVRYRVLPTPAFEYVSPSIEAVLGYAPAALYADPGLLARLAHPDDRHLLRPAPGPPQVADSVVLRLQHADGHWVWLERRSTPVFDAAGTLVAIEGAARDVSDRHRAEASVARLNRVLRTHSAANAALVRAGSEAELLERLCHVVVEEGAYRSAWVGYRDDDGAAAVRPVSSAGYGPGDQVGQGAASHRTERGLGPVDTAVREGRTVVVRDLATDPAAAPGREAARVLGHVSVVAIPLCEASKAFGALVIYSDERDAFGAEEVALLEELAADLAYGVGTLRARAVREAGEAERTRLVTAVEQTAESVLITDAAANIVYVNPAFERTTGYAAAEVIGRNPRILQSGQQPRAFYADMWSTLAAGETWSGELVNRRKDGTTCLEVAVITPVLDAGRTTRSFVAVQRDVTHERALEAREVRRGRERAVIADALAALRPLDTPEQTAEAICTHVVELPEIAMASLLILGSDGNAIPLAMTVDDGRLIERKSLGSKRSAQLRARAALGPWVEEWRRRADHPYLAEHLAIGLRGQAYAPVHSGTTLIGLLTVGSRDPNAVALLAERLPAILEFASLAGALVAPSVALTGVAAATRERCQAIIDEGSFHPVFQPIVDLATREPIGYEALTRFADGTPPDRVFAEARRGGLEQALESVTLRAALAASEALPAGRYLSLNVSPALILAGDELRSILADRTRPVVLEITEHDTIDDYGALRSAFVALGSGLRLAVDDAGAGVANFSHLVELRPQFVKVDIGLVRGVNADLTRQALIVALLHFARSTDCHVVAEGIETEAERAVLEKLEVEFGQGYLFGRPAEATTWALPAVEPMTARQRPALRAIAGGRGPGYEPNRWPPGHEGAVLSAVTSPTPAPVADPGLLATHATVRRAPAR
jgi:PAS domain S-box-containing protein